MNLDEAFARCEEITATEARNFSYGIKLLPKDKRRAMSALYAMARRIDDIGDGDLAASAKLDALSQVRKDLDRVRQDHSGGESFADDPVLLALASATRTFDLPLEALQELVEGCEMDVNGTRYQTFDDLVVYCRRVAGTVGRLSLAVYRSADRPTADPLADDLGVALQITNILRDIVEDQRQMGRVYLPADDLARFGIAPDLGELTSGSATKEQVEAMVALVAYESARAEEWYERGLALLPMLDWRSRACTAAMAGIYRRLLHTIQRDPAAVLRGRLSLPAWQKAAVAARALTAGTA
jgi:phytoene synthase